MSWRFEVAGDKCGLGLFIANVQPDHGTARLADHTIIIAPAPAFEPRFGGKEMCAQTNHRTQNDQAGHDEENSTLKIHEPTLAE